PLRRVFIPRGDALHPVRHRGDIPLPRCRAAEVGRNLCSGGNHRLRGAPLHRVRVRVETRSTRMDLRIQQARAKQLLRGDMADDDLQAYVEERVWLTTLEKAANWGRANSLFPLGFGLACCAIEMISVIGSPRNDVARFGAEAVRGSPRQADMIMISGRVSIKMAPVIRRIYDQMLEPKWVISMV